MLWAFNVLLPNEREKLHPANIYHSYLLEESLRLSEDVFSLGAGSVVGLPPQVLGDAQVLLSLLAALLARVIL